MVPGDRRRPVHSQIDATFRKRVSIRSLGISMPNDLRHLREIDGYINRLEDKRELDVTFFQRGRNHSRDCQAEKQKTNRPTASLLS